MKKQTFIKIISVSLCLVLSLLVFSACGKKPGTIEPVETTTEPTAETTAAPAPTDINPLTGLSGLAASAQGKRPVAVVVENHPDARPQWGLCTPDIVMEGLAEGGITRMLYVYQDISTAPKIGPNRSARHNYVEFAAGLDAIYVHFGGSFAAYNLFSADKSIDHIDGSKGESKYFQRDKSRGVALEHTAYTTGEWLTNCINDKGYRTDIKSDYAHPFTFGETKRTPTTACDSVRIVFSSSYKHTFKYNTDDGLYYNYMNSNPMKDSEGKQMAVNNVIVLYCNVTKYNNDPKLVEWNLTSGTGLYVTNGGCEEIKWEKGKTHDMLKLFDAQGNELVLNTGKSYIGFVPQSNASQTLVEPAARQ